MVLYQRDKPNRIGSRSRIGVRNAVWGGLDSAGSLTHTQIYTVYIYIHTRGSIDGVAAIISLWIRLTAQEVNMDPAAHCYGVTL